MARFFSDYYRPPADANTALAANYKAPLGKAHGRLRVMKVYVLAPVGVLVGEEIRLGQFKSSDRIHSIRVGCSGASGTWTVNIGLYEAGVAHDGAVIDEDLFASALAITTAIDDVEQIDETGTVTRALRGAPLWEQAAAGAASYTADPFEDWDLVMTGATGTSDTAAEPLYVEVQYTSGD